MRHPVLLVPVLLCGCAAPPGVAVPVDRLEVPDQVDLVDIVSGQLFSQDVALFNSGTATADARLSIDAPFTVLDRVRIAPGELVNVRVRVRSTGYDAISGTLTIDTDYVHHQIPVFGRFDADADDDGWPAVGVDRPDCDDLRADVHPDADELCDGADNDCDGMIDELPVDPGTWYRDGDGDTWGSDAAAVVACAPPVGFVGRGGDCDDAAPLVFPGARETWYDGVDQDCSGTSDFDRDGDGFDSAWFGGADCRDGNPSIFPGAVEIWYDGVDQDCSGTSDFDQDGDHWDAPSGGGFDCDDLTATTHPMATEFDDGVDQDCDGRVDETFVARGDLVWTEVFTVPVAATGSDARWVELANLSARAVPLVGFDLDAAGGTGLLGEVVVPAGGVVVLCTQIDPAQNGGVTCDGPLPVPLSEKDQVTLSVEGRVLDEVDWAPWSPLPTGASLELAADALDPDDNDTFAAWCASVTPFGDGDLGTPGVVDPPCDAD